MSMFTSFLDNLVSSVSALLDTPLRAVVQGAGFMAEMLIMGSGYLYSKRDKVPLTLNRAFY